MLRRTTRAGNGTCRGKLLPDGRARLDYRAQSYLHGPVALSRLGAGLPFRFSDRKKSFGYRAALIQGAGAFGTKNPRNKGAFG
jgi:hypothetical protein